MAARYYKGREVLKEYKSGRLVWEKQTAIPDYLCFTALEAGQFTLTIPAAVTPTYLSYVEYSLDGRNWQHTDNTSEAVTINVQVAQGEKVYWRGSGNRCTADSTVATSALNVSSDARFDASGHLLSILKGDDYEDVSGVQRYTFCNLFYQNTALVHAHDLVLPPVGLTGVFFQLFRGCSSLVSPPASIPLTTIPAWGCRGMYYDCSSLITPTDLIATTYGNTACTFMYRGCASLTRIATLPTVTSLVDSAQFQQMYYGCTSLTRAELYTVTAPFKKQLFAAMFYRCTNLSYIKCLYTDLSADQTFADWLNGVSSTGTFIQASGVEWPRGASGIPTGWLAYDEGGAIPNDYTMCDYIYNSSQSGGGVNLGFKFRLLDYTMEAKFKQDDISNGMVIGTNTNDSGAIWFYNYSVAGSFRINACYSSGWKYNVNGFMPLDTDTHIIRYVGDTDGCYQISDGVQGVILDISQWANEESTDNLFIFGRASATNTYKGRIYYLKVWNTATEEVICNLIPCSRNSDGAAGFWDTVRNQFFTSAYWTAHFDNE